MTFFLVGRSPVLIIDVNGAVGEGNHGGMTETRRGNLGTKERWLLLRTDNCARTNIFSAFWLCLLQTRIILQQAFVY